MRIPSFRVENARSIRLAHWDALPRLMVIAGPNGSGKSTLLNSLRSTNGYSNIVYVSPHRAMRKQQVQQRHVMTQVLSYETILTNQSVGAIEGMRILDGNRDPWGYDESANYLKYTLCQIEVDRLQAVGARLDRTGEILKGSIPDPWGPLREVVRNLLPHLQFERIDATNRDRVRVLFKVHQSDTLVDLDDLSSGEKSIIQMFYPLIEREIKGKVTEVDSGPQELQRPEICVLIDEPELHLHPTLQLKVLDYFRVLTSKQPTQVIIATHSPTMVEAATFDELFLLRPIELTPTDDNQLVRIADDDERLSLLRHLFGATHNLTSMQPILVVEGTSEEGGRAVADRQLYRALHPSFDRVTMISGGGKSQCISLASGLRTAMAAFAPGLVVTAILDRDLDHTTPAGVEFLPVAMIENFLIDPDVIFEAIESVRDRTALTTVDAVVAALDGLLDSSRDREVGRRVAGFLGPTYFHPPSVSADVKAAIASYASQFQVQYSDDAVAAATTKAEGAVDAIVKAKRRREEYDGKKLLGDFFRTNLHGQPLSRPVFAFYAARRARRRASVVSYFDEMFKKLRVT